MPIGNDDDEADLVCFRSHINIIICDKIEKESGEDACDNSL